MAVVTPPEAAAARHVGEMPLLIRDCNIDEDRHGLRACVVALQDVERQLEPALPPGEAIADAYLTFLIDQCRRLAGRVLVAEDGRRIAGFVCVLGKVMPGQPEEPPAEYAYISDLIVLPEYQRQGLGRRLLGRAEALAREAGVGTLRVGVLAKNRAAHQFYGSVGFSDFEVELVKLL